MTSGPDIGFYYPLLGSHIVQIAIENLQSAKGQKMMEITSGDLKPFQSIDQETEPASAQLPDQK